MAGVLLLSLSLLLQSALCSQVFSTPSVKHLEPIEGFQIHHLGTHLQSLEPSVKIFDNGHIQPYPDELHVKFEAFGQVFRYNVSVDTELFAPNAKLLVQDSGRIVSEEPLRLTSYRATTEEGWVTVTITPDLLMHAVIALEEDILQVDPIYSHKDDMESSHFSLLEKKATHQMVIFRHSDLKTDDYFCGSVNSIYSALPNQSAPNEMRLGAQGPSRNLLQLVPFTNCWPGQDAKKVLFMSFGLDYGFQRKTLANGSPSASAAAALISSVVTSINSVYFPQMSIWLKVSQVLTQAQSSTDTWNYDRQGQNNCPDISTALNTFSSWKQTVSSQTSYQTGVWHFGTDCYPPPGTVGLAWIGGLCRKYYGAGVSSYSSSFWLTVAHEVGHNFGASHSFQLGVGTTGGIMDYGDGKYQGVYQFHPTYTKADVCAHITKEMSASTCGYQDCVPQDKCWGQFQPACGNGLLEPGETCDDGARNGASDSCCTTTCVAKAGAECSTGECCSSCMFAPTTTSCAGGTGYCSAGTCKQTTCTNYGFPYSPCSTQPGNTCMYQCQYNGACNNMAGWYDSTTKAPFNMNADDGSICSRSPLSKCQAGKCVAATSSATYSWQSSSWSACSSTCGSGTQTRSVWCMDSTGAKVTNSFCSGTAPSSSQTCTQSTCQSYQWKTDESAWSACSTDCNGGTQTQPIPMCYATSNPTVAVASSLCGTPPATTRSCNTNACPVKWLVLSWSTCSRTCGGGTQTPKVVCVKTQNKIQYALADSYCAGQTKPGSRSCNTNACTSGFVLAYGTWSACTVDCGGGNQSRAVECRNDGGQVVDGSNCGGPVAQQSCNTDACPIYVWNTTDFGPCSLSCGSGIQQRNVTCVEQHQNVEVADYLCTLSAPTASQSCNTNPCPDYQWVTSVWGSCSATCGTGVATRTVKCQDISVNADASGQCNGTEPAATQNCSAPACPVYIWSYTDYGTCSVSCGGGTQSRKGTCIIQGTTKQVDNSLCGPMDATSQSCNTSPCGSYVWVPSSWTDCSQVCNGGTQSRVLKCINSVTNVAASANTSCDQSSIPVTMRVCNTNACPGYWWFGTWSQCSKECGGGTYTRTVECRDSGSQAVLGDSQCAGAAPSTTGPCNSVPCPAWNTTAYGPCSAACGDGFATRNVTCYDAFNQIAVDASKCPGTAPASQTTCKLMPCPNWVPTSWGPCSAHCGGGTQTRQLACRFPTDYQNGIPANETLCPETKPPTSQACMTEPCPTYYYSIDNWGTCSTTCGDGVQTGTVTCLNGSVEVSLSNCVGTPPSSSRTCNLRSCPTYSWVSASEWSSCDGVCTTGIQTRQVTCVDTATHTAVSSSFCGPLSVPSAQQCPPLYSCKQGSQCRNATSGNFCKCTLGYSGDDCSIRPEIQNVKVDIAQFPQGIPLGESALVSWESIGYMPFVAILLDKQTWKYPKYISAEAINDIQTSLTTRSFTWRVDNSLPIGNDYQLIVYYSLDVYKTFPETGFFAIADPCAYISCGAYGTCKPTTGTCDCLPGYGGDFCELTPCAKSRCSPITSNCSDSGVSRGFCQCHPGWTGTTCDVPVGCSFKCLNGGFVSGAFSSANPCKNLTCSCQNFFSGKQCEKCQLPCKHGAPDSDCLSCQCGANSGWMGRDCSCRYYILSVHVRNTQLRDNDNTDWVNDPAELATFKDGFAQDIATTLKIAPRRVVPTLVRPDGLFNNSVEVLFLLTQDCVDVAASQSSVFPIVREVPVHFDLEALQGESGSIQYRLLEANTPVNGESPSLDELVTTLRSSLDDRDSAFSRGYVTSGVLAGQGLQLVSSPQGEQTPKRAWIDDNYWVIIVAAGGLLLVLISVVCWVKRRKPVPIVYEHETLPTEPAARDKKTKALFQGELSKKPDSEAEMTNIELPEGWTKMFEDRTGQYYYYNTKSGVSQWELPTEPA